MELFPVEPTSPERPLHALRRSCRCGSDDGYIEARGSQDCVFCRGCRAFQYNAPRLETGRAVRSLSSRPGITPAQRARILETFGHACIACGRRAPAVVLTLEHIISRENAERFDMLDALIDSEWNLAPMCEEDNSGHRWLNRPSVELMYRALQMRALTGHVEESRSPPER